MNTLNALSVLLPLHSPCAIPLPPTIHLSYSKGKCQSCMGEEEKKNGWLHDALHYTHIICWRSRQDLDKSKKEVSMLAVGLWELQPQERNLS